MGFLHAASGAVGGAIMAAFLWLILTPLRTLLPWQIDLAALLCLAVVVILGEWEKVPLPRNPRQVPRRWAERYGPNLSYALYGLWLGAGLATNITYTVEYLPFFGSALLLSLPGALLVGAAFGLGRTILVGPLGLVQSAAALWDRMYHASRRPRAVLNCLIAVGLALGLLVSALWG